METGGPEKAKRVKAEAKSDWQCAVKVGRAAL